MNGVLAFGIHKIFFPINTWLVPVPVPFNMVCCPIFVTKQINRLEVSRSNWCLWREGFRKVPESNKQVYTSPMRRSEPHCCNALVRLKARDKTLTHIVTFRLISWFFNLDTQSIYDYMCPAYLWYLIRITGMSFFCYSTIVTELSSDQVVFLLLGIDRLKGQELVKSLYLLKSKRPSNAVRDLRNKSKPFSFNWLI